MPPEIPSGRGVTCVPSSFHQHPFYADPQLLWEVESELGLRASGLPVLGLQVMSVLAEP